MFTRPIDPPSQNYCPVLSPTIARRTDVLAHIGFARPASSEAYGAIVLKPTRKEMVEIDIRCIISIVNGVGAVEGHQRAPAPAMKPTLDHCRPPFDCGRFRPRRQTTKQELVHR